MVKSCFKCFQQNVVLSGCRRSVFDTNFLGRQSTGPTVSIFMFISKIVSVIRADAIVFFFKNVRPDGELSAIGRQTDVNFEH